MTKIMKGGLSYCATSNMMALTQAQYNALSTAQKNNGNFYFITDANPSYFSAANIDYDNTDSGLSATDIQGAIDEVVVDKMDKTNPTGTGFFSLNRKSGTTVGNYSFAEGFNTTASNFSSHAEGVTTVASGNYSHAEGSGATASDSCSHAEGGATTASGSCSHAEGSSTAATNVASHAEGYLTTASGQYSHTEGSGTTASSSNAHAEGFGTTASSAQAHAEGVVTTASGSSSHAEGEYTIANHLAQHVFGQYNIADPSTATAYENGNYIEIVGNGTSTSARSNARTLDWSGNEVLSGSLSATGCSISNTSSPRVSITSDATVGGSITLYNTYNNKVIDINNTASRSQMDFYHAGLGGLSGVSINTSSGYGAISVRGTTSSTSSASISASNYGSSVTVSTLSGTACGQMQGTSTGGIVSVKDSNGTETIKLEGSNGNITCSTVNGYNLGNKVNYVNLGSNGILASIKSGLIPAGVNFVYCQNATDKPSAAPAGIVDFCIVCNPTGTSATYNYIYLFHANKIFIASTSSSAPTSLSWSQMV